MTIFVIFHGFLDIAPLLVSPLPWSIHHPFAWFHMISTCPFSFLYTYQVLQNSLGDHLESCRNILCVSIRLWTYKAVILNSTHSNYFNITMQFHFSVYTCITFLFLADISAISFFNIIYNLLFGYFLNVCSSCKRSW